MGKETRWRFWREGNKVRKVGVKRVPVSVHVDLGKMRKLRWRGDGQAAGALN